MPLLERKRKGEPFPVPTREPGVGLNPAPPTRGEVHETLGRRFLPMVTADRTADETLANLETLASFWVLPTREGNQGRLFETISDGT